MGVAFCRRTGSGSARAGGLSGSNVTVSGGAGGCTLTSTCQARKADNIATWISAVTRRAEAKRFRSG
jgi:hypothetical protein